MSTAQTNTFLDDPLGPVYFRTALPIIFVMAMSGLLAVADALFLGYYVGPGALAAVTLMFPLYMLIIALSTLVSGGMSSLLARRLGAHDIAQARAVFAGAHGNACDVGLWNRHVFDPHAAQVYHAMRLRARRGRGGNLFRLAVLSGAKRGDHAGEKACVLIREFGCLLGLL